MIPYFFSQVYKSKCWICGTDKQLSREHKIKASSIRRYFSPEPLLIGSDDGIDPMRLVRGPKSDELKFPASICTTCNNEVTSKADRAHDRLMKMLTDQVTDKDSIQNILNLPEMRWPHQEFVENSRYFAKLLGCHIAQDHFPVPKRLSCFVSGRSDLVPVRMSIKTDPKYVYLSSLLLDDKLEYAAHGGLLITTDAKRNYLPTAFVTSVSLEHVQIIIQYQINALEVTEMRLRFPGFIKMCRSAGLAAAEDPSTDEKMRRMGYLED